MAKTCEIKMTIATDAEMGTMPFAQLVMGYVEKLQAVETPVGFKVTANVGEPRSPRKASA